MTNQLNELWRNGRAGAHAGRGFRYQDAIATHLACTGWVRELPIQAVIPEGLEDISLQFAEGWVHAQAKSRLSLRGDFGIAEVLNHLEDAWAKHEQRSSVQQGARLVLILERPVQGLPETGWTRSIAEVPGLADALRPGLMQRLTSDARVEALMATTSVVVSAEPRDLDLAVLSDRLGLPPQACLVHYRAIYAKVGELSDENRTRGVDNPAQLVISEVQRLVDEATALIDLNALEEAIRIGVCEVVDFSTPLHDARFWEGVDVGPGHVVAGLPVERPELEEDILGGLFSRRATLIVGPSGAGKSALAWMSAYASRHLVRWYRVKRVEASDIEPLLRLVRAGMPSDRAPMGFVVDDLGHAAREGWDLLVEETAHRPGVLLLGVAREEDLSLLETANRCHLARPALEEELAREIWSELDVLGMSRWTDWREPFEISKGLLLEYSYLLTAGERLSETITEQVARRLRESRDLELKALRAVAVADAWGAAIPTDALRLVLDVSEEPLQRALWRLLDEHLIREEVPGLLGGLHKLRSRHIVEASRRIPPPTLQETVGIVVASVDARSLQRFVAGLGAEGRVPDDVLLDHLAERLRADPDPQLLVAVLQALRLVSFRRQATDWTDILREEGVSPSQKINTAMFALAGTPTDLMAPEILAAVARLTPQLRDDLRELLLDRLSDSCMGAIVDRIDNVEQAAELLTVLVGVEPWPAMVAALRSLGSLIPARGVVSLADCLSAARAVSVDLALHLVQQAGGPNALLARIERERPFVRDLRTSTDDEGRLVVEGVVRYVAPSVQLDVHAQVVDLCRLVLACVPTAEVAACRAIDASGQTAGDGGRPLADMRIRRRSLPVGAEVAWNRARLRTIAALVAAESKTERLAAERTLLERTEHFLARAADCYCRGNKLSSKLERERRRLVVDADGLLPSPSDAGQELRPNEQGEVDEIDQAAFLAKGIADNLIRRLFDASAPQASVAAFINDTLRGHADRLSERGHWRLHSDLPFAVVEAIDLNLAQLHAVVAERAVRGPGARAELVAFCRRAPTGLALARCSELARTRAEQRLEGSLKRISGLLAQAGYHTQVFRRAPTKPKGFDWPPDEIAIAVEVPTVFDWILAQPAILEACRQVFEPARTVVAAPMREGLIVASLGGRIRSQFLSTPDLLTGWKSDLPVAFHDERAASAMLQWVNSLSEVSGILGGATGGYLHDDERAAADAVAAKSEAAATELVTLASDDDTGYVREVLAMVRPIVASVHDQVLAFQQGQNTDARLAAAFASVNRGEESADANIVGLARLALIEWVIEPAGASARVELAVQRLASVRNDS